MCKVLFVGDINVDIIMGGLVSPPQLDKEVTCESYELTLGSSAAICACAYAALGGQAWFSGLAGNDDYGEFMIKGMQGFGIHTEHIEKTEEVQTGVTVNLIYKQTRSQVTYPGTIAHFSGENLTGELLREFDHVHFAGPYQQTKFRPRITSMLKLVETLGVTSSLDPQWDPTEQWEYVEEWLPLLSFFFLNEDEAKSITGKANVVEAFRTLKQATRCPVVKLGERGVLVEVDGEQRVIPAFETEVVDTTGAGDSFDAAFLYAVLEKKAPILAAAEFANAAAARSCCFAGGVNARSTFEDVRQFMREHRRRAV